MLPDNLRIKKSAVNALGLYAKQPIIANSRIIEYVGKKVTQKQAESIASENGCIYLFELSQRYLIDGDVEYNSAKYSNHSCTPNCAIDIAKGRIWLEALRDIEKGEELTYDYGFDRADWYERPCRCQSALFRLLWQKASKCDC